MTATKFSKSDQLLFESYAFEHRSTKVLKSMSGELETCQGTAALWRYLTTCGFVVQTNKRGGLGHPFCYKLTDAGRQRVEEICAIKNGERQ